MRNAAIALLVLLAGCATPGEVRRDGSRSDWTLRLPPAEAAACMARNAEEHWSNAVPTVRGNEVIIRAGGSDVFAVADVQPAGAGSRATIYRYAVPIFPTGLPEAMAKGC